MRAASRRRRTLFVPYFHNLYVYYAHARHLSRSISAISISLYPCSIKRSDPLDDARPRTAERCAEEMYLNRDITFALPLFVALAHASNVFFPREITPPIDRLARETAERTVGNARSGK